MRSIIITPLLGIAIALAAACSSSSARECHAGADCASGACSADGQCLPNGQPTSDATATTPDGAGDASPSTDAAVDAKTNGCVPNHDGIISREEVPLQAGLHATYKVGHAETVSTAGVTQPDGSRIWDFSGALASDVSTIVETLPLTGKWYAASFSNASYATTLRNDSDLLGVFQTPAAAIQLLGVASPDDGFTSTKLTYDPPVPVLTFPLKKGSAWTTDTFISGTASGVVSAYSEKYESTADAEGELKTPLGSFHVIRVGVKLMRTVGFLVTTYRTFAFVTECYGTVASVASDDNEANVEFTHAAEIRRIAP